MGWLWPSLPHCVRFQLLTLKNESKSIGRDTQIPQRRIQAKPGAQGGWEEQEGCACYWRAKTKKESRREREMLSINLQCWQQLCVVSVACATELVHVTQYIRHCVYNLRSSEAVKNEAKEAGREGRKVKASEWRLGLQLWAFQWLWVGENNSHGGTQEIKILLFHCHSQGYQSSVRRNLPEAGVKSGLCVRVHLPWCRNSTQIPVRKKMVFWEPHSTVLCDSTCLSKYPLSNTLDMFF